MIISPPYILPRNADETDEAWIRRCMPGGEPGDGSYPLSHALQWHGGLHLIEPDVNAQVRAIADGDVVFWREPSVQPKGSLPPDHAQAYGGGWTDNGVMILKHTTEIGDGSDARVTFFSIYMHLREIDAKVKQPKAGIYRKAPLGRAGSVFGTTGRLHFEIVCDDANLQRLVGRASGELNVATNGRTDAIYGAMYFYLPAGTPVYGEKPILNNPVAHRQSTRSAGAIRNAALQAVYTTTQDLFVGLCYAGGQGVAENRGDASLSTYQLDGTRIGEALEENGAEYNLYRDATAISNAYPVSGRPAPSAVYELLRFGRVIGPDALNPTNVPHWRRICYSGGVGWVNLNAANVKVFSDADFPHWMGWSLIDDSADQDSRCDSATIKGWLDVNGDGKVAPAEALARMGMHSVASNLVRSICKFPTEWNVASFDRRLGWIKTSTVENPTPVDTANFERLRAHVSALAFWPGNTGLPESNWHWNPREFIKLFRSCGWLSDFGLSRIYPSTPVEVRTRYLGALNLVLRRYGMNTPKRAAHFFAQGHVETLDLRLMVEGSVSFARNPGHASFQVENNGFYADPHDLYGYFHNYERRGNDLGNVQQSQLRDVTGSLLPVVIGRDTRNRPIITTPTIVQIDPNRSQVGDGMKFRGRGFKQLTGRSNYAHYWVFRGWLRSGHDFDENWWIPSQRPTDPPRRPAQILNPQVLSVNEFNCIDSGGQFSARNDVARPADAGITRADADNVSRIVNRWDAPSFARRFNGTINSYEVLGP